jgi:sortase (surface protein transpeptidase)
MRKFLSILLVLSTIFTLSLATTNIDIDNKTAEAAKVKNPSITIPSIGMKNQKLQYATIKKIDNLYTKMRQTPIVESAYSPDLCTKKKNAYVMGHSEPSYFGEMGSGLYVFSRLEEVEIGDIIKVTNIQGEECSYKVTEWDFVRTDKNDQITRDQFNKLFYPKNGEKSTLTIQTCQKGSSTVRLILRAEMI